MPNRTLLLALAASLVVLLMTAPSTALTGGPTNRSNYTFIDNASAGGPSYVAASFGSPTTALFPASQWNGAVTGIPLGFTFRFYGTDYTSINAHENGFLYFSGVVAAGAQPPPPHPPVASMGAWPGSGPSVPSIAAFWADFDASFGCPGSITYETQGVAPTRKFTIRYNSMAYLAADGLAFCGSGATTFRTVLYETSNIIEIYFDTVSWARTCCPADRQPTEMLPIVVGVKASNTNGLQYYNSAGNPTGLAGNVVRFRPANTAPAPVADTASTNEVTAVVTTVLANDADIDNANPVAPSTAADNAMDVTIATAPANGAAVVLPGNTVQYTPNVGFYGTDSYVYRVTNTASPVWVSPSGTATVTINVNDVPNTIGDTYAAIEATTLVVASPGVLGNDIDNDHATSALTATLVGGSTTSAGGTVSLLGGGGFTYTPPAAFSGTDTFQYRAGDPLSSGNTATVSIIVNGKPTVASDAYTTPYDTTLTVAAPGVLGNDADPEGLPLVATLATGPTKAASFTLEADGSFTYTPMAGTSGTDTFTYRAGDGVSTTLATVTITIDAPGATPALPPLGNDDSYSAVQNTPLAVGPRGVLGNDIDYEGLGIEAVLMSSPSFGSLGLSSNGGFTYTPNTGFVGTDSFTYRPKGALDGNTATVSITVSPYLPPRADFQFIMSGRVATFTDTSMPGSHPITSWEWMYSDGRTSTIRSPQFEFDKRGFVYATLKVTDSFGLSDMMTRAIYVPTDPTQPLAPRATPSSSAAPAPAPAAA
jgi:hypothetical protein